jgi:hypothetical protein
MSSNILPSYTPYTADPLKAKSRFDIHSENQEFIESAFGISIHALAILGSLVGGSLAIGEISSVYCNIPFQIQMCFLAIACAFQCIFSACSFSKVFLVSEKFKFARCYLTSTIPTCFAAAASIWIGMSQKCTEVAIILAPIVLLIFYLPYYFYLTNEKSILRPFVKL